MGRNKGRQCGGFSSKSKRASYLSELYTNAETDTADARCRKRHSFRERSAKEAPVTRRPNVDVRHLATLIQQRRMQDRSPPSASASVYRDRLFGAAARRRRPPLVSDVSDVGWILDRAETEGNIPSLQTLAARALAHVLPQYVSQLGEDYIHRHVTTLPASTIAEISSYCVGVTDALVHVLGNHSHLHSLVLNGAPASKPDLLHSDTSADAPRKTSTLTDAGLKRLIPQLLPCNQHHTHQHNSNHSDSWETLESLNDDDLFSGCWKLRRLELHHHDTESKTINNLTLLLERCSQITHLSLNNSLNRITGPALLFPPCNAPSPEHSNSLLDVLKDLHTLHFSHCKWLNYDILLSFLRCIKRITTTNVSLQIISVMHCSPDIDEQIVKLNKFTCNKPVISTLSHKRT